MNNQMGGEEEEPIRTDFAELGPPTGGGHIAKLVER